MVSDMERARPNNKILVSKDWNCSEMTVGNISRRTLHQYGISTTIEGWGLVYWEVGKSKVVSKCGFSQML